MKEEMTDFFDNENAGFKDFVDECVNRFKWLLKKYGMGANLPSEDALHTISPDPFTGTLNEADAIEHKNQHENEESHAHGDYV